MHPNWNSHTLSPAYERAKPRLRKGVTIQAYVRKYSCLYLVETNLHLTTSTEHPVGQMALISATIPSQAHHPLRIRAEQHLHWVCNIVNQSSCLSLLNPENTGVSSARYCSTSSYSDVSADTQFLALSLMKSRKLSHQLITPTETCREAQD